MYYNISVDISLQRRLERIFMELILISDDKLKIMLSEEDMQKYHISGDGFDYSKLSTRTVLKSILSDAKTLTGFDTEGERFFVQLFTSAHGGCELFITKGEQDDYTADTEIEKKTPPARRTYQSLYSFDSFYNLISSCRRLTPFMKDIDSVAYSDISGRYFLSLKHANLSPYTRLDKFTFLLEYGRRENSESFEKYIQEYGNWICKDAVSVLGTL